MSKTVVLLDVFVELQYVVFAGFFDEENVKKNRIYLQ